MPGVERREDGAQTNIKTLADQQTSTIHYNQPCLQFRAIYHTWRGWKLPYVPHSNNSLRIHFAGLVNPIIAA